MKGAFNMPKWLLRLITAAVLTIIILLISREFAGNTSTTFLTRPGGFLNDYAMSVKIV